MHVNHGKMTFDIKLSPSMNNFNLEIITNEIERKTVRIISKNGVLLKELSLSPYQKNISLGSDLCAETYTIEVEQGNEFKRTTFLKT